ncbi:MAG: arginine--tRNA ligase, partial [archaeon]|nr:arginine--tRNA ligase [archaeon]
MKDFVFEIIKNALKKLGVKAEDEKIMSSVEVPKDYSYGDFAFPCFVLAGIMKMPPHEIAIEIRKAIGNTPIEFENIETEGPYINFFLNRRNLALETMRKIKKEGDNFGDNNIGKKERTMIEFSQPNTHKAFHVGHIRGTSIGESLARISEFNGEKVVRANYSGDTGMHIAKWIWCYKKYHSREKLKNDEKWIASIYVDAVKRLSKLKNGQEEVDDINRKLESKEDSKINSLWEKTRKLSIKSWEKIYRELNTHFDVHFFESEVEKRGKEISNELIKIGIAKISDGATIIKFEDKNLGVWVLLRKDGTVLYSAKDLALAEIKFKKYKIEKSIYIIGSEQSLHIAQLFKTLELMKFENAKKCRFIPFSEVRLPSGKMSSRSGENVLYSEFMDELVDYTKKEIKERDKKIPKKELEKRALAIS